MVNKEDNEYFDAVERVKYLNNEIEKLRYKYKRLRSHQINLQCEINSNIYQMDNERNYLALRYNIQITNP